MISNNFLLRTSNHLLKFVFRQMWLRQKVFLQQDPRTRGPEDPRTRGHEYHGDQRTRGPEDQRLGRRGFLLFLPQVNLHVSPPLVASGELPPALVTGEGFLSGVRADVRGEVVAAAEVAHADAALKGFVARVDAQVPAQLVRPREPAVAALRRTRVRPLVHRRLAGPVRVLSGSHDRPQREVLVAGEGGGHRTIGGR